MHLTFVTGNAGKLREVREALVPLGYEVMGDARGYTEIQADTLQEVAAYGADELRASGLAPPFLLEDSGLFVPVLGGFPGVHSRHALDTIGLTGLLRLMAGQVGSARRAYFEANLCLVDAAGIHHYAGRVEGSLAEAPRGTGGFGFDPLFVPDDPAARGRTFAEMTGEEKGAISHRGRAVAQLVEALRKAANR